MLNIESNKDLIAEIKGGIKKEVSTYTKPKKMVCSICGTDNMEKYCRHWPGGSYAVEDGTPTGTKKRCKMLLSGASEAYELSFVAVPAQPRAGTHKSVGFTKPIKPETNEPEVKDVDHNKDLDLLNERIANARLKRNESIFYAQNSKEDI